MKCTFFLLLFCTTTVYAQFTQADSLRGGYGSTRNWWDITQFNLAVRFQLDRHEISGCNTITFAINELHEINAKTILQIDLQEPLLLDSVILNHQKISPADIQKNGAAHFILIKNQIQQLQMQGNQLELFYHGQPRIARNAPWDGGLVYSTDKNGKPWVSVACQGLGASCWYPCKDSQVDEPQQGVTTQFTVPDSLVCISNGVFQEKQLHHNGWATYKWKVHHPINNYCVIPYIGDYVNVHQHFTGEKGNLELDYWVLNGNEAIATRHFEDVPKTLQALEYWFGPYPFYEDGYKLVEAPYLGMEHQSAVAYGNQYKNGYLGRDLSGTGIGLKWDFIIVHETGHEWYGNSITANDIADMWIHESFTCYSETLFTDYWFGKEAGDTYCQGIRKNVLNDKPIIGQYNVHNEGSGDMYYKGANMLHIIRTMVNNDSVFRAMLRKMNVTFYHQNVNSAQIEQFISNELHIDCSAIFDCYLRSTILPILQLNYRKNKVSYRWKNMPHDFKMIIQTDEHTLIVRKKWQHILLSEPTYICIPSNYYIQTVITQTKSFSKKLHQTELTTCP